MNCPKCGTPDAFKSGVQLVAYYSVRYGVHRYPDWPMQHRSTVPHPEALLLQCGTCGYRTYQPTVDRGGPPVVLPSPKRA